MTTPDGEKSTESGAASSQHENRKKSARTASSTARTVRKTGTESTKSSGGQGGARAKKKQGLGSAQKVMWLGSLALFIACISAYIYLQSLKADKDKGKVEKIVFEPEKDIKAAMAEGERNFRAAHEELDFDAKKEKLREAHKFFESASNKIDELRSQERFSGQPYEYLENDYQMKAGSRLKEIREMLHVLDQQEIKRKRTEEKSDTNNPPSVPNVHKSEEEDLDSRGPVDG